MAKDYYHILGVKKDASQEDIKKAFRVLAHKHHPDKKEGNAAAFKEANEAYSVLSDEKKRIQYDRYGSGFSAGGPGAGGFDASQGFGGFDFSQYAQNFAGQGVEFDLGDIFADFFGGRGGRPREKRGRDISVDTEITFKESIFGLDRTIALTRVSSGKKDVTIRIPSGIENGETLRVSGGGEVIEEGKPGDLYVRIHVKAHPYLRKEGYHLVTDLSIKLSMALVGGEILLETLDGSLTLKIPAGIAFGEILRVRDKGVPYDKSRRGDLLVRISIDMPRKLSKQAAKLIEELKKEGI